MSSWVPLALGLSKAFVLSMIVYVCYMGYYDRPSPAPKYFGFLIGFGIFLFNEVLLYAAATLGLFWRWHSVEYYWVFYYALQIVGFLALLYGCDAQRYAERPDRLRKKIRNLGIWAAAAMAIALGLIVRLPLLPSTLPTPDQLGWRAVALGLAEIAVVFFLGLRSLEQIGLFAKPSQQNVFVVGCVGLFAGAIGRYFNGPREFASRVGYTLMGLAVLRSLFDEVKVATASDMAEKEAELRLLHQITSRLKSTFDLEELFEILMDNVLGTMHAEAGAVFLVEEGKLRARAIRGAYPAPRPVTQAAMRKTRFLHDAISQMRIDFGEGLVGRAAASGEAIFIPDATDHPEIEQTLPDLITIRTTMAIPLKIGDQVYGVIHIVNKQDQQAFTDRDMEFMDMVVEQAALAIYNAQLHSEIVEKQRTEQELRVAREVQLRLIPSRLPEIKDFDVSAVYRAAQEVGGDYYDFYEIDGRHIGIVIADVAGKGVPGALVMIMTRTILKMISASTLSTAATMASINDAIGPEMQRGMFVTALYVILDTADKTILVSSAGHNPMALYRAETGECELVKPRGIALGFARSPRFDDLTEERRIPLQVGDRIFLYTDGVTEARNRTMDEFGEDRLYDLIQRHNGAPSQELLDTIMHEIDTHRGGEAQYDDISMVTLRRIQ